VVGQKIESAYSYEPNTHTATVEEPFRKRMSHRRPRSMEELCFVLLKTTLCDMRCSKRLTPGVEFVEHSHALVCRVRYLPLFSRNIPDKTLRKSR